MLIGLSKLGVVWGQVKDMSLPKSEMIFYSKHDLFPNQKQKVALWIWLKKSFFFSFKQLQERKRRMWHGRGG
jgi:hypothetical protein